MARGTSVESVAVVSFGDDTLDPTVLVEAQLRTENERLREQVRMLREALDRAYDQLHHDDPACCCDRAFCVKCIVEDALVEDALARTEPQP